MADHLGNTRVSFDTPHDTLKVEQQDDYLPFGMEIAMGSAATPKNEYLYNKKELQEDSQIYDYGARFYDPVVGRFTTVDPLAEDDFENLMPYNYAENNPIIMIDPDGMAADSTNKPKPTPKPIELKEVKVTAKTSHKNNDADFPLVLGANANKVPKWLWAADLVSQEIPVLDVALDIATVYYLTKDVKFSKVGTPRKKTTKQLKKEWEAATGKKWPKEPGNPNKDQVVSHIKPLADGGEDGYPNIEPKPAREHIDEHILKGDFKRWGSTRTN